jgi:hypothetical protein
MIYLGVIAKKMSTFESRNKKSRSNYVIIADVRIGTQTGYLPHTCSSDKILYNLLSEAHYD